MSVASVRQPGLTLHWAKPLFRAETVVFLTFWLLLMLGAQGRVFTDPGSLWHIVVGDRILSSGQLPHSDSFSFTFAGRPWIAQWWLGECALALAHRAGGLDAIMLLTITLQAFFLSWLAYRLLRIGIHPLLAFLFTALAFMGISFHFHPRPHLMTILLMGWTFACLCDYEAGRMPLRRLFWLVPIYILWTNVHGGMVGGVATIGLASIGWCVTKGLGKDSPITGVSDILWLSLLVLACALTAFVNPYGIEMPRVWFQLFSSPVLPKLIDEHAPLLTRYVGWAIVVIGFIYVVALLGVLPKSPRVTWLIPLVWLYLAWGRSRHGPLFAVTAVIALAEMFPHLRWVRWLVQKGSQSCRLRPKQAACRQRLGWGPAILAIGLACAGLCLQAAAVPAPLLGRGWVKLDAQEWPLELLPELREYERSHAQATPIFNDMLFGGFLIYHTPGLRIFIDDRCELYGDDQLLAYAHALFEEPGQIERWRQQYGFDVALVVPDSKFDHYLESATGWVAVRRTKAAIFYRRIPGHESGQLPGAEATRGAGTAGGKHAGQP